jgi:hypothetical protein
MGCGRCWSAGFSRLKWKYFCSAKDCSEKPELMMKYILLPTAPNPYRIYFKKVV